MTTALAVQQDRHVVSLRAEAASIVAQAASLVVATQVDAERATALLGRIAAFRRAAEDRRKFFVGPLNDHVKAINGLFRELVAPFDEADGTLRGKLAAWRRAEQERLARERREAEERARAEEARAREILRHADRHTREEALEAFRRADEAAEAADAVPVAPGPTLRAEAARVTARKVWDFEVVDLAQVPHEFVTLNEPTVRAAIRAGVRQIPGLRIYEREQLAVRGGPQ
ncbi:MAG: hypothetical protein QN174_07640 [Armatimonadota bacterium]|nr:hypothetical protein [Armatimonadota bacterium]